MACSGWLPDARKSCSTYRWPAGYKGEGHRGSPFFLGHPCPSNIPLKDRQLPSSKALLWGARVPNPSSPPASQGEGTWFPPSNSISYDLSRNLPSWHLRCFVLRGSLQPLAWGSLPNGWSGRQRPVRFLRLVSDAGERLSRTTRMDGWERVDRLRTKHLGYAR